MRKCFLLAAVVSLLSIPATAQVLTQPPAPAKGTSFLTSLAGGNFTVPSGVTQLQVAMCGSGGGGGGVANAAATSAAGTTGIFITATMIVTPGQVIAWTIGAKGTGGTAGNNAGNPGNDTTFGSLTAKGGLGGAGSASGNAAATSQATIAPQIAASRLAPTANAFLTQITVTNPLAGTAGNTSINTAISIPWASGITQTGPNVAGSNDTGYCGGGGGATSSTGGAFAGGDGSQGAIAVSW